MLVLAMTSPYVTTLADSPSTEFEENAYKFSVDLVDATLRELDFLKDVENHPELFTSTMMRGAIYRYENYWLPLIFEHTGVAGRLITLAPPLDIHWVWHCHMLSPYFYEKDCLRVVNDVIDHKIMTTAERSLATTATKLIWEKKYPNEPFDLNEKARARFHK
jgi:hypothetical protein